MNEKKNLCYSQYKSGSLKVKRHDVILTKSEKQGSEQGEGGTSCHHITIIEESATESPEEDSEDVPQSLEDDGQSTVDELKEVNLGTIEKPHPTFISASFSSEEKAVHHLAIKPGYWSIKQAQRHFRPELIPQIEVEVNKLIEAGFIRELRMNPLKYAFGVTLGKFLGFIPIKEQVLTGFLPDHPIPSDWKFCEDLPDGEVFLTDVMEPGTIDGAIQRSGVRADIVLISLEKHMLPYSFALGLFLRYLGNEESIKAVKEAHVGICGAHQSGPKLQFQLRRMSYYWPKMIQDSMGYAKKCEVCQYHANFIHQPLEPLHSTMASWTFKA
ncbi:uncharacterized protein E5676_scaffold21G002060 [Cucumis melo var. makuwa]|uniref:Integrase zinc-binding domain-containing protein n=1 Tax=Cucumis melo var. makuwa TaxID=1194695 RepID=A0A5D3CWW6_CUCMM|nr:uncharacterized protein E5676_scaffold21G002060 [Cucumis melo var. makuwa]